jgi:hypothetical protein
MGLVSHDGMVCVSVWCGAPSSFVVSPAPLSHHTRAQLSLSLSCSLSHAHTTTTTLRCSLSNNNSSSQPTTALKTKRAHLVELENGGGHVELRKQALGLLLYVFLLLCVGDVERGRKQRRRARQREPPTPPLFRRAAADKRTPCCSTGSMSCCRPRPCCRRPSS